MQVVLSRCSFKSYAEQTADTTESLGQLLGTELACRPPSSGWPEPQTHPEAKKHMIRDMNINY
eukprot:6367622-Amphidinium_carterae.1